MRKFVETLEQLAHEIYAMKQRYPEFTGEIPSNADLDTCWICEESFKENDQTVRDHCHVTGTFLGIPNGKLNGKLSISLQ